MYFEALQIFCDVVRHQSFSKGASANAVSQSAASQAIRQLERRLGAQLIDRSKRPWQLTPEGRLFFEGCQEIVARFQELEDAVRRQLEPFGVHRSRGRDLLGRAPRHEPVCRPVSGLDPGSRGRAGVHASRPGL